MNVPFEIPEISNGFKQASGLMKLWAEGIELEFEVATLGIFKSGVKDARVSYSDLKSIEHKKGWMSDTIILEGTSMRVLQDIPGTDVATCTLKIKKKHRKEAQDLVSKARLELSEQKLQQMDDSDYK